MWWALARFEIRYQLRQPVFYLVASALAVLLFVAGTGHGPGGAPGQLHLNAPAVIAEQLVKANYLVLFLMTALVASAAVRDFERRTDALFLSKPVSRLAYLIGRFAGVMAVCVLACLVGAAALAASSLMPGVDPSRLGPFRLAAFAFALGVLIIPTVLALGAACFAVASWTRSTLATCLAAVAMFATGAVAGTMASGPGPDWLAQLLDPFGVQALADTLRYWTVAELNSSIPAISGALLSNRIVWLAVGLAALAAAVLRFDPTRRRPRFEVNPDGPGGASADPAVHVLAPNSQPVFSRRTVLAQVLRQLRRETYGIVASPTFLGMLALGLLVLFQAAGSAGDLFGMPVHPRTHLMVAALRDGYAIVLLLLVVVYSGELVWKERTLGLSEVQDAMPTPVGVHIGAKLAALLLAVAVYLLAGVVALVAFQLANGHGDLQPSLYAGGVALAAIYPVLMIVLAGICHVVAPNRFVGYGLVIVFIVSWDLLEEFGFEHHLYRYASLPATSWSDFSGHQPFLVPFAWYGLYWGFVALALAGLATLFWKQGTDPDWRGRRARARARFEGGVRALVVVGTIGAIGTGTWIFYNTNVLNEYLPGPDAADRRASYERLYRQHRHLDLPRIVAVRADVDLFPELGSVAIRGRYRLRNGSGKPLRELHVSFPEPVLDRRLDLPDHEVLLEDSTLGYGIYRLRVPIPPGGEIGVGFALAGGRRGFVNHGTPTAVLDNGSYFTRRDLFPVIGYDAHRQLTDPDERRQRGLEPVLPMPGPEAAGARSNTPRASDADRIDFESTVSTDIDQIAVTSGELQREWIEDGRRHFHYRSSTPITHHFAYASARYDVARSNWNGIAIEVYHHPRHGANVGRMIEATRKSLDYYTANFGPYQHRHLRIVEFPGHVRDAQSLPGLIAYSESLGFNARLDGTEAIDFPFYVTAHEVAHQWWGQQLVGANVPGVGMLHETLAQYSALMVLEDEVGPERLQRVLAHERDWYLRGRASDQGTEPPLAQVERQEHVYYHKGALAMHALRDAVGEATLNQALKRYLARVRFQEAPYTTTQELLEEIRQTVPNEAAHLVEDLFERVTMHDVRLVAATARALPDGRFLARAELTARKLQSDAAGTPREVELDDWLEIAIFTDDGDTGHDDSPPILAKRRLRSSPAVFEFVVGRQPTALEVDPQFKLIERDRSDNVRTVSPVPPPPAG